VGQWFKRREVLLPTPRTWVLVVALTLSLGFVAVHKVHGFLAQRHPAPGARLLVVEGWLWEDALDEAIDVYRAGGYSLLVTTGGPIEYWTGSHGFATFRSVPQTTSCGKACL
jgi:hypothetical protein